MTIKTTPNLKVVSLLSDFIKQCSFSANKNTNPCTKELFLSYEVPSIDTKHGKHQGFIEVLGDDTNSLLLDSANLLGADSVTNNILYYPQSCLGWHTNSDLEGYRTYYTYTLKPGIFRYEDPKLNKIVLDVDNVGWTSRTFLIQKDKPFWHSVWSDGYRFSFGFNHA
jgi:hypothetical protein